MSKKTDPSRRRTLIYYILFGIVVIFTASILVFWIFQEITQPIPMALLIGALVAVAFKLFSDALSREQRGGGRSRLSEDRENRGNESEGIAPRDEK